MEIAAWADRCYLLTPHQKRRFPAKCDFRTSAGFLEGRAKREALRLRGGGPAAVVTDLGLLEPDETGELTLTAIHPGVDPASARANTGWDLRLSTSLRTTDPPTAEELQILRAFDPDRIYLNAAA
jgi:glutaconate CoA-transferase subunit B